MQDFQHYCDDYSLSLQSFSANSQSRILLEKIVSLLHSKIVDGKLIAIMGNGGSMADASHFSAELSVRYQSNRSAFRSVALASDTAFLTACSNDFGYEDVFKRSVESLCTEGDVVIGITTSGKSTNIISALKYAKQIGCITICFCGNYTSLVDPLCDLTVSYPSSNTSFIQSFHRMLYHWIAETLESLYFTQ